MRSGDAVELFSWRIFVRLAAILGAVATLSFFLVSHPVARAQAQRLSQSEWTGIKCIIAIGDIHGDAPAMIKILRELQLINSTNQWSGGDCHLVMMGDLLAGDPQSDIVLDLLMQLTLQAEAAGGRVHSLLGNHDLRVASGLFDKMSKAERLAFVPPEMVGQVKVKKYLREQFLGDGKYAAWMASRPLAIKLNNDRLFVHAGFDKLALSYTLDELNALARQWILYFQGRAVMPSPETQWVVGLKGGRFKDDIGPAFLRDFKVNHKMIGTSKRPSGCMTRGDLRRIHDHFGVKHQVVGHAPTPNGNIIDCHPYYGDRVTLLDTRISDEMLGQLSALKITEAGTMIHYIERSAQPTVGIGSECKDALTFP